MDINEAKKYIESFPPEFQQSKFLELTSFHRGFIEGHQVGHDSREAEVGELKKLLKEWMVGSDCFCSDYIANKEPCTFCVTEAFLKRLEAK